MSERERQRHLAFNRIFEMSGGWACVRPAGDWHKPFRFMGPVELKAKESIRKPRMRRVPCTVKHQTAKAWLVIVDAQSEDENDPFEFWVPKSRCQIYEEDGESILEIEEWLWQQKLADAEQFE